MAIDSGAAHLLALPKEVWRKPRRQLSTRREARFAGAALGVVLLLVSAEVAPGLAGEDGVGPVPGVHRLLATEKPANSVGILFVAVSRCRPSLPENERWRIAGLIDHESRRYGYDPLFVQALVEVESSCSPTARSPRGAVGLLQLKPSTARAVAIEAGMVWHGVETLLRPVFSVQLGLRYLSQLEEQFRDPFVAMAAYNLGPSKVAGMSRWRARRAVYVRKILARYEDLLAEHAVGRS